MEKNQNVENLSISKEQMKDINAKIATISDEDASALVKILAEAKASNIPINSVLTNRAINLNPSAYFEEIGTTKRHTTLPTLSKEMAEMGDILTKQMLSTYSFTIRPLILAPRTVQSSKSTENTKS